MTETSIKQTLYPMLTLGRMICGACCDGLHFKRCEGYECQCACRDPQPVRKLKVKRDKNGLTEKERSVQADLPFDSFTPLKL
jgi:hypothetical protein